jgi:hypothetical protein
MIELSWATKGARTVDLTIDGSKAASYGNGSHTDLFALACDGKPHVYTLTARAGGSTATQSLTITSKPA